jgi:hypothetical protein
LRPGVLERLVDLGADVSETVRARGDRVAVDTDTFLDLDLGVAGGTEGCAHRSLSFEWKWSIRQDGAQDASPVE